MAAATLGAVSRPGERGQATLLVLGVVAALLTGLLVLLALGQAVGAHGRSQSAADLAAMSAAAAMRGGYPRLFEPAFLESGVPNPRHLSIAAYLALTRAAARRVAARNGAAPGRVTVSFPVRLRAHAGDRDRPRVRHRAGSRPARAGAGSGAGQGGGRARAHERRHAGRAGPGERWWL